MPSFLTGLPMDFFSSSHFCVPLGRVAITWKEENYLWNYNIHCGITSLCLISICTYFNSLQSAAGNWIRNDLRHGSSNNHLGFSPKTPGKGHWYKRSRSLCWIIPGPGNWWIYDPDLVGGVYSFYVTIRALGRAIYILKLR